MKKFIAMLMIVALIGTMVGCGNKASEEEKSSENDTVVITDSVGVEVEVPTNCDEIICVWPSGTQLFITLGMGDLLVGVSDDSKSQSWAIEMYPRLTEITSCSNEESAESIIGMNADVVLTTEPDVAADWRSKGIPAVTFSYYSVDEMKETIRTLSKFVPDDYAKKCIAYIDCLEGNINEVETALSGKIEIKDTLYYIHGNNNKGLYKTAGGGTMNEAWANAAFVNFATSKLLSSSETVVDAEAILAENPTVIVVGGKYQHRLATELKNTEEWSNISAVQENRIYTVPYGISPFDRFGAEFALMIPWVATTVYPDLYEFDVHEEIKSFYAKFTGCELSDEQVDYIVNGLAPNGKEDISNE